MNRILLASLAVASLTLPGCIIVSGGSTSSTYRSVGVVDRATMDGIIAANAQNRIGDDEATVLARFPAETVTLMRAATDTNGQTLTTYRVQASERSRPVQFTRYMLFRDGRLSLLTTESRELPRPSGVDGVD